MGGRPTGQPKTGGREKGTRNRMDAKHRKAIAESGLTPLDYMLNVLRDEKAPKEDRMWAAQHAAPFVHPKLSAIEHAGNVGGSFQHENIDAEEARKRVAEQFAEYTGHQESDPPVVH